jgi:hypothetical protein
MDSSLFQNYFVFNSLFNDMKKDKKTIGDPQGNSQYKYPKEHKLEKLRRSLKFKEEGDKLFQQIRQSEQTRKDHNRKSKGLDKEIKPLEMFRNILY